jgi:hypothetical protein
MKIVAVPKTIDDDLYATDVTFGFDTIVATATDAVDKIHTTPEQHRGDGRGHGPGRWLDSRCPRAAPGPRTSS